MRATALESLVIVRFTGPIQTLLNAAFVALQKGEFLMNAFALENPQAGEFWLARFGFEENDGRYKVRPVLVLESRPYGTKVVFCGTQKLEDTASRTEVLLSDEEAISVGLRQAGRICFANHRVISRVDMLRRVGALGVPGEKLSALKFREMALAVQAAGVL